MISNRKYCGDLVYFKFDSGKVLNKNSTYKVRPEDDWIVHEDVIPAIVSKQLFEKAQNLRSERVCTTRGKKNANTEYSRLLICSNCGAYYGRNIANGKFLMNCMTKKRFGVKRCDYPNIKVEDLDILMKIIGERSLYKSILYGKNEKIEYLESLKVKLKEKINSDTPAEYSELINELNNLHDKKQRLLDIYADGMFDKKTLEEKVNEINLEIDQIQNTVNEITMPVNELEDQIKNLDKRIAEISKLKIKKVYSKEEIIALIEKITVKHIFKKIHLTVYFKLGETVASAIDTLKLSTDDQNDLFSPTFYYDLPVSNNTPSRIPKDLYTIKEGINIETVRNELDRQRIEKIKNYNRLTSE
jgi:prefoldin subunit 5